MQLLKQLLSNMTYFTIKIIHVTSAALLISVILQTIYLWRTEKINFTSVQKRALCFVGPMSLVQLISGFNLISIKNYPPQAFWVAGSITSFILFILTWFIFIFSLFFPRRLKTQFSSLILAVSFIILMVFFMSSRIEL